MHPAKSLFYVFLALLALAQMGCSSKGEREDMPPRTMSFTALLPVCITSYEYWRLSPPKKYAGRFKAHANIAVNNLDTMEFNHGLDSIIIHQVLANHNSGVESYIIDFYSWKSGEDMRLDYDCEGDYRFGPDLEGKVISHFCNVELDRNGDTWEADIESAIMVKGSVYYEKGSYSAKPPYTKTINSKGNE